MNGLWMLLQTYARVPPYQCKFSLAARALLIFMHLTQSLCKIGPLSQGGKLVNAWAPE